MYRESLSSLLGPPCLAPEGDSPSYGHTRPRLRIDTREIVGERIAGATRLGADLVDGHRACRHQHDNQRQRAAPSDAATTTLGASG